MRSAIFVLLLAVMLPGCANWAGYNKQRDFIDNQPSVVFVDAKQRAVISNQQSGSATQQQMLRRFCAEPSPDALSAFAASAGLNLSVPTKGDLGYSQAFSEGAASIGLRTQSIQLLRDVMFTNCEAFINGGITGFGLETMQRRFQSTMVAVLAIEQLTGAVKANQVALGGQAAANNAEVLGAAIKLVAQTETAAKASKTQLDAAAAAAKVANSAFSDFKTAHKDDTASDDYKAAKDKSDTADATLADAKKTNADREADLDAAKAVRTAATTAGGSGAVSVLIAPVTSLNNMANNTAAISTAVSEIVKSTFELGFGREVCTTLFGQLISLDNPRRLSREESELTTTCLAQLNDVHALATAEIDRYKKDAENQARALELIDKIVALSAAGKLTPAAADKLMAGLGALVTKPAPTPPSVIFSAPYELKKK
jgi:hypothetical protein